MLLPPLLIAESAYIFDFLFKIKANGISRQPDIKQKPVKFHERFQSVHQIIETPYCKAIIYQIEGIHNL